MRLQLYLLPVVALALLCAWPANFFPATTLREALLPSLNAAISRSSTFKGAFWPLEGFEVVTDLRAAAPAIHREFQRFRQQYPVADFRELDKDSTEQMRHFLSLYSIEAAFVHEIFPRTMAVLSGHAASVTSVFFSSLRRPGQAHPLSWHRGPYKGIIRYHLPLHVPLCEGAGRWVNNSVLEVMDDHWAQTRQSCEEAAGGAETARCKQVQACDLHEFECLHRHCMTHRRGWASGEKNAYGDFIFEERNGHRVLSSIAGDECEARVVLVVDLLRPDLGWWWRQLNGLVAKWLIPLQGDARRIIDAQTAAVFQGELDKNKNRNKNDGRTGVGYSERAAIWGSDGSDDAGTGECSRERPEMKWALRIWLLGIFILLGTILAIITTSSPAVYYPADSEDDDSDSERIPAAGRSNN